MLASQLPRGTAKQLVVYAVGPGYGESVVVLLPDGRVVVVDGCSHDGRNLTAQLLDALSVTRIDLLVVSHPDSDHLRGLADSIGKYDPALVWVYPQYVSLRDLVASALKGKPSAGAGRRLGDLRALQDALDERFEQNRALEMRAGTEEWGDRENGEIRVIAPLQADISEAGKDLRALARSIVENRALPVALEDYLDGKKGSALSDHPNQLSLALSIRWGSRRLLLAGDLEHHAKKPHRGWNGVVADLKRAGRLDRIRGVDVVKVAHHGSDGAFCEEAWKLHRESRDVLVGLICPFNRSGELPAAAALTSLRPHATNLGVSSVSDTVKQRLVDSGWVPASDAIRLDTPLPIVGVSIPAVGSPQLYLGGCAHGFA
jgi:hypothetical protein